MPPGSGFCMPAEGGNLGLRGLVCTNFSVCSVPSACPEARLSRRRVLKTHLPFRSLHAMPSNERLTEIRDVLLETYAVNDAMNQLLLTHLDPRAWRAQPPALTGRGGRPIAAIFAHLHNIRLNWLKNSAPHLKRPAPLDPHRCTMRQTSAALKRSAKQCLLMLTDALSADPNRNVTKFTRDSWMPTWPAGASMFL